MRVGWVEVGLVKCRVGVEVGSVNCRVGWVELGLVNCRVGVGWVEVGGVGWVEVGFVNGWAMVDWVDGSLVGIGEGRLGAVPGKNSGKNPPFKTGVLVVKLSKPSITKIASSWFLSSDCEMTGALVFCISSFRGGIGDGSGGIESSRSSSSEMTGALGFRVSSFRGGIGDGSGGIVLSRSSSSEMTEALGFHVSSFRGGIGDRSGGIVSSSLSPASLDILASGVPYWNKKLSHSLGVGYEAGFSIGL